MLTTYRGLKMYYAHGYLVYDFMNEPLRWFETKEEAQRFVWNTKDCRIVKQKIDWDREPPCLF